MPTRAPRTPPFEIRSSPIAGRGAFAIPVFGVLAETVATSTHARLKPRGAIFAAIALIGTAMYGAAVQAPVVIRAGFSSLTGNEKVSDLLPFALVHLLPDWIHVLPEGA